VIGRFKQPVSRRKEPLTALGQRDARAAAVEYDAELGLEARDPLGQRLLGQEQRLRSPTEVPVLRRGDERSYLPQVQLHTVTLSQPTVVKAARPVLESRGAFRCPGWQSMTLTIKEGSH
jgi:hypothetical protein